MKLTEISTVGSEGDSARSKKRWISGALTWLSIVLLPSLSTAQLGPIFQISEVENNVGEPSVSATPNGGFRVVWVEGPSNERMVRLRNFDANGEPLGVEWSLLGDLTDTFIPVAPRIATLTTGESIVTFRDSHEVVVVPIAADGTPGAPSPISNTTDRIFSPEVSVAGESQFVVVWHQEYYFDYGGDFGFWQPRPIKSRLVAPSGAPVDTEKELSGSPGLNPKAARTDNGFVAAWTTTSSQNQEGYPAFRLFDESSTELGDTLFGADPIFGRLVDVAVTSDGDIARLTHTNAATENNTLVLGYFDPQGDLTTPLAGVTDPFGFEGDGEMAFLEEGELFVTWLDSSTQQPDGDAKGRVFVSPEQPLQEEFFLNKNASLTSSGDPSVDRLSNGDMIVVWRGMNNSLERHIFARRYLGTDGLLVDDFESGDFGCWSCFTLDGASCPTP